VTSMLPCLIMGSYGGWMRRQSNISAGWLHAMGLNLRTMRARRLPKLKARYSLTRQVMVDQAIG
jgi:hypothetical protein